MIAKIIYKFRVCITFARQRKFNNGAPTERVLQTASGVYQGCEYETDQFKSVLQENKVLSIAFYTFSPSFRQFAETNSVLLPKFLSVAQPMQTNGNPMEPSLEGTMGGVRART